MSQKDQLRRFVRDNLDRLFYDGGGGTYPQMPEFDLSAQKYISYAEEELGLYQDEDKEGRHLINCVSHLKRAVDCQLDTFLYSYGLYELFDERNLSVGCKLDFLDRAGVFRSRSLERLNQKRNRMEHDYVIPRVKDIEAYYDLVYAFTAVLQRTIVFTKNAELDFTIGHWEDSVGYFSMHYVFDSPAIKANWRIEDKGTTELYSEASEDIDEFTFFLKVLLLLHQRHSLPGDDYLQRRLKAT